MSLFVFSSILLETTSSSTSCVISGRLLLLPPRLKLDDVEEELRPESGTGDAWHSRRKSKHPPEHDRGTGVRSETTYGGSFACLISFPYLLTCVSIRKEDVGSSTSCVLTCPNNLYDWQLSSVTAPWSFTNVFFLQDINNGTEAVTKTEKKFGCFLWISSAALS